MAFTSCLLSSVAILVFPFLYHLVMFSKSTCILFDAGNQIKFALKAAPVMLLFHPLDSNNPRSDRKFTAWQRLGLNRHLFEMVVTRLMIRHEHFPRLRKNTY